MRPGTAIIWGLVSFLNSLAMVIVFDREAVIGWSLAQGLSWGVYVLYCAVRG
jgi:hypothetical protein